jgi:hypothetical protein
LFAQMMRTLMYPHKSDRATCTGKGGKAGAHYMMERARSMLMAQGHDGDRSKIMMVGDRFDTDVRAGISAGFMTCLVLTGCHTMEVQKYYRADPVDFFVPSVGGLVPTLPPASRTSTRLPRARAVEVKAVASDAGAADEAVSARESEMELSDVEPSQSLEYWMLMQGNLWSSGSASRHRAKLDQALRMYFDRFLDTDGNGVIDSSELRNALESIGMGMKLDAAAADVGTAATQIADGGAQRASPAVDPQSPGANISPLAPLAPRAPEHVPPVVAKLLAPGGGVFRALCCVRDEDKDLKLSFDDFKVLMEEALAECGVEARKHIGRSSRTLLPSPCAPVGGNEAPRDLWWADILVRKGSGSGLRGSGSVR